VFQRLCHIVAASEAGEKGQPVVKKTVELIENSFRIRANAGMRPQASGFGRKDPKIK